MKEIIFKQWTAEDLSFNFQTKLTFAQCDKNGRMTWAELLRMTSDGAGEDFTMRDMGWQRLSDMGIVFVVSRASFHIIKMPKYEDQITLVTWEEVPSGPLYTRRYEIRNTLTGEVMITSHSLWTLLDFKNKKIVPAKNFTLRPTPEKKTEYDGILSGKISQNEDMQLFGNHKVVFSDCDANGHCNNSKYMNFVMDSLPLEFQDKEFHDLRINYSKEVLYGENIELFGQIDQDAKKITVIGKVSGTVSFETELYY